jgi:hypothetical protein
MKLSQVMGQTRHHVLDALLAQGSAISHTDSETLRKDDQNAERVPQDLRQNGLSPMRIAKYLRIE